MPEPRRIVLALLTLFLLVGSLAGCSTTPGDTRTPALTSARTVASTPTPRLMVRVVIQIDDVQCNGKQSVFWWQFDKFYMVTTFSASGPTPRSAVVTQSQISQPVQIKNNQDLALSDGSLVVLDALVPLDGTIRGGFIAFNGGVATDEIAQFASWVFTITKNVANQLQNDSVDSANLYLETGARILSLGSQAFLALLAPSDNPTRLGYQPIEITANGKETDPETLTFIQKNGPGSTWNYLIHYTIIRTFL
jgi:hypothetical protein